MWLIAEDEADIRNLIAAMFQIWGHLPLMFESGQKVWDWLDQLEKNPPEKLPELVLMDIRMPGKRGNELANRMRQIPALKQIPIVLMTAFTLSDGEKREMMSVDGVDYILSKPLPDLEQLRATLHQVASTRTVN